MKEIKIEKSRQKILLLSLGCLLFIIAGYWIFETSNNPARHYHPIYLKTIGIVSIIFGSIGLFYSLKALFDSKHSLVINEVGIIDNSGGISVGLIEWEDITGIKTSQVRSTNFILLFVKNHENYISNSNFLKRILLRWNYKMYGTPISISSTSLQYNLDELVQELRLGLERYNNKN